MIRTTITRYLIAGMNISSVQDLVEYEWFKKIGKNL